LIYFSSDWHYGHNNILKYSNRPFATIEEHDEYIIHMVNDIEPESTIYFLGDLAFAKKHDEFFSQLRDDVNFVWIRGNHDKYKHIKQFVENYRVSLHERYETSIQHRYIVMSHYPMYTWNHSSRNSWLLYGHHHNGTVNPNTVGKALNVNFEFHNYKMWTFDEICAEMQNKENNFDFIER